MVKWLKRERLIALGSVGGKQNANVKLGGIIMNYQLLIGVLILVSLLSACVARSAIILPSKYDREAAISNYQACVTAATTNFYDTVRPPEQIVRASFSSCMGQRSAMLSAYPKGWAWV